MSKVILLCILSFLPVAAAAQSAELPACPPAGKPEAVDAWRTALREARNSTSPERLATHMQNCFPGDSMPECMGRLYETTVQQWMRNDPFFFRPVTLPNEKQMRTPPPEFQMNSSGEFVLFQKDPRTGRIKDIEQIAKEKGWPVVRYKSRHSGGFDEETSSLLMIRVPGERMNPPVDYDQYINIALPADTGERTMLQSQVNPIPQKKIPGQEDYDKENRGGDRMPRVFTMMTVKKATAHSPSTVFFDKFNRGNGPTFTQEQSPTVRQSCYECHPNGLRPISPLGYGVNSGQIAGGQVMPPDEWKAVQEMNSSMNINMGFRPQNWGEVLDRSGKKHKSLNPNAMGPIVGPVVPLTKETKKNANGQTVTAYPTRTKEFILGADGKSGCAMDRTTLSYPDIFGRAPGRDNTYTMSANPQIDYKKVTKAMKCASCHNGRVRDPLTVGTDWKTIAYKILVDQTMPHGAHRNPLEAGENPRGNAQDDLNNDERIALTNCLRREFEMERGKMSEWISAVSCSQTQPATRTGGAPVTSEEPTPTRGGATSAE